MGKNEELLTVQQVAAWLKVPVATIYQWRYRGEGPRGIRVGRYVRYRRADVDAFLNERMDPRPAA
ncbi:MAG: helix-turn-helix transcriptional regulator [Egibacteraceae bacterium]